MKTKHRNFQEWHDRLIAIAERHCIADLVNKDSVDVDDLRDAYEMGYSPIEYLSEQLSYCRD